MSLKKSAITSMKKVGKIKKSMKQSHSRMVGEKVGKMKKVDE